MRSCWKYISCLLFAVVLLPLAATEKSAISSAAGNLQYGIPAIPDVFLVKQGFVIGYSNKYRQAEWAGYTLTANELSATKVTRGNKFYLDPFISQSPVQPEDYNRTGYDRGHLVPAADMRFSETTMRDSFLMTNISPQNPSCNRGIWKRLETKVRKFAMEEKEIYIITGPVFGTMCTEQKMLGETDIPIPVAFYKVIYDTTSPQKMIAFIIPNSASKKPVRTFAVTVDDVEALTGLNFFSALPVNQEKELENKIDVTLWKWN